MRGLVGVYRGILSGLVHPLAELRIDFMKLLLYVCSKLACHSRAFKDTVYLPVLLNLRKAGYGAGSWASCSRSEDGSARFGITRLGALAEEGVM